MLNKLDKLNEMVEDIDDTKARAFSRYFDMELGLDLLNSISQPLFRQRRRNALTENHEKT